MNIPAIRREIARAVATEQSGNPLAAARIALDAQRAAAQSRSRHAYGLEFRAHGLAALAIKRVADAPQPVRSELGKIAAASKWHFQRGGTASRAAIQA